MGIMIRHPNIPAALREVTPAELGVDAVAGNALTHGSWVNCDGYNQATVFTYYVADDASSAEELKFAIEVSNVGASMFTLAPSVLQTSSVSAGVATLSDLQFSKDTNNTTVSFVVDFPLNYKYFRILALSMTTGHADDDITMRAFLGKV